jgi:Rieske 2Fe-2S family protein
MGAPNMQEVERFDASEYSLHYVPTVVWEGFIFLNFSQNPESFQEAFAPIYFRFTEWQIPSLQMTHQITYDIAANWKLIFQNYSECYHCPTVHPLLAALTPYKASTNRLDDGPFLGGPMALGGATASMTMDGANCAAPIATVCGDNLKLVHYYTIFPSMFLTLLPDYVMVHRAQPLSADRTLVHCEFYFHPDAANQPGYQPEKAVEFWDLTNRQDWHVCELSQQGISSRGYSPGPYAEMESLLAAFDREYLRVMDRENVVGAGL